VFILLCNKKKPLMKGTWCIFLVLLFCAFTAHAQVIFYEDFQQGIPNSFTLINGDAKTPAAQVAFVNNAWVADEYNSITKDSAAVSTSWYTVAATADDWMITPAITLSGNSTLSWEAFASDPDFRDGYEVRISTTGNAVGNFTTVLFSTGAEQTSPIVRYANLNPYSGQTVYLAFRNNSFNKNLLFIDDIKVELKPPFDLGVDISARPTPYTLIPRSQQKTFTPSVTVINEGSNTLSSAKVFAAIYKNNQLVKLDSNNVNSLATGLVSTLSFTPYTTTDSGLYQLVYFTQIPQQDGNSLNDTMKYNFWVTDSLYARDNGIVTGTTSIGASSGEFGHTFEIVNPSRIKAATVYLNNPSVGSVTKFRLYSFSNAPGTIVDSTVSYVTTLADSLNGKTLALNFIGNTKLSAGKYLLTIVEQGVKKLNVGTTDAVYSQRVNWYRFSGNPFFRWASGEEYDSLSASNAYTKVLAMRLNLENACSVQPNFGFVTKPTCTNKGSIAVNYTSDNVAPYQYKWSTNQTTAAINNLTPGAYIVTVTDGAGCKFVGKDTVKNVPITISMQVNDVSCKGGDNGFATANPNGGNGSYTYVWNTVPTQTGKIATGLRPGIYTVTVTDGSCVSSTIAPVVEPAASLVVTVTQRTNPSNTGANDGSITVTATGGESPYQYVWNDSVVSQTISNISTGKYCVSVTDNRQCEVEKCDTIGVGVSIKNIEAGMLKLYPQPASHSLLIETTLQHYAVGIFDIRGALLMRSDDESNTTSIDVASLPAGVYMLQLMHEDGMLQRRVIVAR